MIEQGLDPNDIYQNPDQLIIYQNIFRVIKG